MSVCRLSLTNHADQMQGSTGLRGGVPSQPFRCVVKCFQIESKKGSFSNGGLLL
jgi:hypothetical protein